jgi:hypothetical protein
MTKRNDGKGKPWIQAQGSRRGFPSNHWRAVRSFNAVASAILLSEATFLLAAPTANRKLVAWPESQPIVLSPAPDGRTLTPLQSPGGNGNLSEMIEEFRTKMSLALQEGACIIERCFSLM